MAQALVVLLDGSDTSGTTLTFAMYEFAFHPEIQQSVRDEMRKVLSKNGGQLTYDGMQDMS